MIEPPSAPFVVGALAAVDAFQPSLMPTPPVDRGIAAGAAAVTAGATAAVIDSLLGSSRARTVAVVSGAVAAGALRRRQGEHLGWASARAAAIAAATTAATGLAMGPLRRRPALAWAATAAALGWTLRDRLRRHEGDGNHPPDAGSTATALGVAAGMGAAVSAATATAAIGASSTAVAVGAAALGLRALARHHEEANNHIEPGYRVAPEAPTVSGGPASAVDFTTMGGHGRRFVLETRTREQIAAVLGEPATADPVRVYVGYRSAATMEERVALAVEELRRTGAMERSLLVVASPSGTGYVNYIASDACEYLSRGDSAWVAVQYGMRPSIISSDRLIPGGRHHRALLEAVAAECRRMAAPPRVVVFGESLGAHTSQNAFLHRGVAALDAVSVDRALYVGTPYRSKWKSQVLASGSLEVGRFDSITDYAALDPECRRRLRVFLLDHDNDPVTKFGIDLAVQRPEWLGPPDTRPATISTTQRWAPVVTFWQTLLDTKNAATALPGVFGATGHDYRADLARFVSAAFALDTVSERQMAAVEEALRLADAERTARTDTEPAPPVIL